MLKFGEEEPVRLLDAGLPVALPGDVLRVPPVLVSVLRCNDVSKVPVAGDAVEVTFPETCLLVRSLEELLPLLELLL